MRTKFFKYLIYITFTILIFIGCDTENNIKVDQFNQSIPLRGNSWVIQGENNFRNMFRSNGLQNWRNRNTKIRTYFHIGEKGKLKIACRAKVDSGKSQIKYNFNNNTKKVTIANTSYDTIPIGSFNINESGYQSIDIQGLEKTSSNFAQISDLLIGGEAAQGKSHFVEDEYYFGRRGPSVHLNYQEPQETEKVTWFYNEIEVPKGEDVIGSYFMANGFRNGYFGIQVNSKDERRILFSVWSPYETDDPEEIPKDSRIKLLKKGPNVQAGKFGNEGSGGQSFRKYLWKAGHTYRFLLKGVPSKNNSTDYTAYFYAPEIGKWELIASFRRPKTGTYLGGLHSFLENFIPSQGNISRKAYYKNQWVRDSKGNWYELDKVRFTADNTARKKARLDYAGGIANKNDFFLKNCGFFNNRTEIGKRFKRESTGKHPSIDFSELP